MIEVHVTCTDEEEAKKISLALLKEKLAACANYFPVRSVYWWEGRIEEDSEAMLILKMNGKNKDDAVAKIKRIHSYDLPVITIHDVKATKESLDWADKACKCPS